MSLNTAELNELQRLEDIALNAAIPVSELIEGSFVTDGGASPFVYIPFEGEVNGEGDELHATVAVDTLDNGEHAKWTIHYDFGEEVWVSEYDSTTDPAVVAAWAKETLDTYRAS